MYYSYQKSYYLCSRKQKESSMAEKTEKRGGRRAGAGRPKGDSRLFSFRCSGELAEKIGSMENRTEFINASLSRALERCFGAKDAQDRINQKSASMVRLLKGQIERCEKKLALQEEELASAARMEEYRLMGEMINANLWQLRSPSGSPLLSQGGIQNS